MSYVLNPQGLIVNTTTYEAFSPNTVIEGILERVKTVIMDSGAFGEKVFSTGGGGALTDAVAEFNTRVMAALSNDPNKVGLLVDALVEDLADYAIQRKSEVDAIFADLGIETGGEGKKDTHPIKAISVIRYVFTEILDTLEEEAEQEAEQEEGQEEEE